MASLCMHDWLCYIIMICNTVGAVGIASVGADAGCTVGIGGLRGQGVLNTVVITSCVVLPGLLEWHMGLGCGMGQLLPSMQLVLAKSCFGALIVEQL